METYNPQWSDEEKKKWLSEQSGSIVQSQESKAAVSKKNMDEKRENEEREREEKELQLQIELGRTRIMGGKQQTTPEDLRPSSFSSSAEDVVANEDSLVKGERFEKRKDYDLKKNKGSEES